MRRKPIRRKTTRRKLINISALLFAVTLLLQIICIPTSARRTQLQYLTFRPENNYQERQFYYKKIFASHYVEDDEWLSSYASISATERSAAASSDITAETYVENELQDPVWCNIYLHASYLRLDIILDSGETYKTAVASRSSIDGGLCRLSVSDVGEFDENDIIKHYGSVHMLYIGCPKYESDVPKGHPNVLIYMFSSRDYDPI